eukprot:TRINITY_DN13607_c0_g1_i3.p1 TRINITY_DN13607_c0_g1~~TRINITY_DN13607_c0_g1_i3.p1  ORF type:complete len:708 (+),score=123.70 TRINITY_DN13607_c0_g1_i3:252-2126(+)
MGLDGLIAVTGIPGFAKMREEALRGAHACMTNTPPSMQSTLLSDGTTRQTLAAVSSASLGQQAIHHGSDSMACRDWERGSQRFRRVIGSTLDLFTKWLSGVIGAADPGTPMLRSVGSHSYDTLEKMIQAGERLEHFHTYRVNQGVDRDFDGKMSETIEFHVDQGMFIAFVPAMLVDSASLPLDASTPTGIFKIKFGGGEELEAEFSPDSLVIMAGDGFNQYVNDRHLSFSLHAPIHAFQMPQIMSDAHRVWYGLMQLPPPDALSEETGLTFEETRSLIIGAASGDQQGALGLGCSRKLRARELASTCSESQMYCWHRCMDFTEEVSPSACAAKNLGFNCTSQFDQIYLPENGHGDYNLACTNSTELVSPRPAVAQPTETCSGWQELVDDPAYKHRAALVPDETYFLWNVVDDNALQGKMIHKGLVGWLAFGIENVCDERHNGMNGGHIVMGSNLDGDSRIGEYKIHEQMSAFRHWKTPLSPSALQDAGMTLTNCFSSMEFKTETIYGMSLNISSGSNRFIWALSRNAYVTDDYGGYAPYHSNVINNRSERERFRGKVQLDLAQGSQSSNDEKTPDASCSATQAGSETKADPEDAVPSGAALSAHLMLSTTALLGYLSTWDAQLL